MAETRRTPLVALLTANAISTTGNVVTMVAIPWFVLTTTGSASRMGVVVFFTSLPAVISTFFGGTLVDRLGFKPSSVVADLASGVSVALVPLLYATVGLPFWQLIVLAFAGALLDAPGVTARQALLPDLAALAGVPLERANSWQQSIHRGASLLGAPLAGVVIAAFGATTALWIDAATFAVSALLVGLFVTSRRAERVGRAGYLTELKEGLVFLLREPLVRTIALIVMMTNFIDAPVFALVLPVYARQNLDGARDLGFALGVFGGAALVGALLYGWVGPRLPRRGVFLSCFAALAVLWWLLALQPGLVGTLLVLAAAGLAAGPINPVIMTAEQERVPEELRGRVFGATTSLAYVAMPVGMLVFGVALERLGLTTVLFASAALYALVWVLMVLSRPLRQFGGAGAQVAATD
jgi:predicted MFS family arabinose efflux permease